MAPAILLVGDVNRQVGRDILDDLACHVSIAGQCTVVAIPAFEIGAGVELRVLGVDLDDAAGCVAAEQSSLRALENINPGNGVQPKMDASPVGM